MRRPAVLLLVVWHNIGTAARQKLPCEIGKNRVAVFYLRFLGISCLLILLAMPKNRPFWMRLAAISRKKTALS
jgi:hypothetical protein